MSRDILELGASLGFLDELYERQAVEPGAIDPSWQALMGPGPMAVQAKSNGQAGPNGQNGTNGHAKTNGEPQNGMAVQNAPETVLDASIAISRGTTRRMPSISRPGAVTLSPLANDIRVRMLALRINAETFERFCHTKYPGTKRFSLEGSESLIPVLDLILSHGASSGSIEAVLGMAHRGRLTALESLMRRPARELFGQFEDIEPEKALGGGDVKYHLGFSTDRIDANGNAMHVSLAFNPSHLEAVDPVVCGRGRAKQVRHGDVEMRRVMGILVHGDAAFAGQGLVPETLQLSRLQGFRTGGTVHVIVNNQVGFTASPAEQRSTPYCTDFAKMLVCPIWHVNGEDLDALACVVKIASYYRVQFGSDVVLDIYSYRKYGHNETDEPAFTQPVMYDRIKTKPSPVEVYSQRLIAEGVGTADEVAAMTARRVSELEPAFVSA